MDAAYRRSPNLMEVLRSTLESVEKSAEFSADDPALEEFKRSILRVIADLQLRREHKLNRPLQGSEKNPRTALMLIVKPGGNAGPTEL